MNKILLDNPPEGLTKINREKLIHMDIPEKIINNKMTTDIVKIDRTIWQINRKGTLIGIFPIDYLAWTTDVSRVAAVAEKSPQAEQREVWLEGSASPASNKALTARGWKVKERVGLLTGDPLQNQTAAAAGAKATTTVIKTITP